MTPGALADPRQRAKRRVMTRRCLFLSIALIGAALLAGCPAGSPSARSGADGKLRVAVTTGMIADIAKNVGGDRVEVTALMGPGTDPHYYKATAGDIRTLTGADLIFYNGLELEGRMTETLEKLREGGRKTVAVAEGIPVEKLRQPREFQGRYDPHVWFDAKLWQYPVRAAAKALAEQDPAGAAAYERNAATYLAELEKLDAYARAEIAKIPEPQRILITAHDAFGYFGRAYGIEVRGLQGTSTTAEAGARDVQDLAKLIAERKIKAIFVESSVPPATIEAVQKAVAARGWNVQIGGQLFSDAMGAEGKPEGTYAGMFRHNVDTIVGALK
jgi:ABC-type metal ion transport system, periplasmic component/surface adhesin